MDPENKQAPEEAPEQELEKQFASSVVYAAKAIPFGIAAFTAAFTGGLSKVGELLWGLIASRVLGGISFGGLHGPGPVKPNTGVSFFQKYKTALLLLGLVVGVVLLPFVLLFMHFFTTTSGFISEPLVPIDH